MNIAYEVSLGHLTACAILLIFATAGLTRLYCRMREDDAYLRGVTTERCRMTIILCGARAAANRHGIALGRKLERAAQARGDEWTRSEPKRKEWELVEKPGKESTLPGLQDVAVAILGMRK